MQNVERSTLKLWLSKNGWKLALFMLLFVFLIGGYYFGSMPPEKGDFTFDLPDGYKIVDISDKSCSIVDSNDTVVGGFILTNLKAKDVRNQNSFALNTYLNDLVYGFEYLSWTEGSFWHPVRYFDLFETIPDRQEKKVYTRILFVKDFGVYDMWFDNDLINGIAISEFYPIAGIN